jgi:ribosome biogenesis GTPase
VDRFCLGWNPALDQYLEKFDLNSFVRITTKHKTVFRAVTVYGDELNCYVPGKMLHDATPAELPAVGDWCIVGDKFVDESNEPAATIMKLVPRYSKISRMSAGTDSGEQLLAANIDFVFIVTSANKDFSINRLQRYVLLARSGGTQPVIVLSKTDLVDHELLGSIIEDLQNAFPDLPYACISSVSGSGIDQVRGLISAGQTAVFVGSSGVGKSTLVNKLLARHLQRTQDVRDADDKGRHTTSGSGLFFLDTGGMIIDTPGLREVQVVGDANELETMMPTVAEFAGSCKFANCNHGNEPGCAVQAALADGTLSPQEFGNYVRLQREVAFARRKLDQRLESAERKKWKRVAIEARRRDKAR